MNVHMWTDRRLLESGSMDLSPGNLHESNLTLHIHFFGPSGKEPTCQCRRHKRCGFDLWVRKIPWRRKWKSTPVFLYLQGNLAGYIVHRVTKSQTRLKRLSTLSFFIIVHRMMYKQHAPLAVGCYMVSVLMLGFVFWWWWQGCCTTWLVGSQFPTQGLNPGPWAVKAASPNDLTTKEFQFWCLALCSWLYNGPKGHGAVAHE